jgi:hypothetical protein
MLISLTTLLANLSSIFHSRAALQLENLALRSSWGIWLCATDTKSACFSDPRENDQN